MKCRGERYEIFRVVSHFPHYISFYIAEICLTFLTVYATKLANDLMVQKWKMLQFFATGTIVGYSRYYTKKGISPVLPNLPSDAVTIK